MKKFRLLLLLAVFIPLAASAYTVQYGDTLTELAKRFGTTVRTITEDNSIKDPNKIYVGQELQIGNSLGVTVARPEIGVSINLTQALALGGSETSVYLSTLPDEAPGYLMINPTSVTSRELVKYTATSTSGGNHVTGVTRGLAFFGSTSTVAISDNYVSTNAKRHSSGEAVALSNGRYEQNFADVLNGLTTSTIKGTDGNNFSIGDNTTVTKCVKVINGTGPNYPKFCYDQSTSKWLLYNDGVTSVDIAAGGSGVSAGKGISINASIVTFNPAPTSTSGLGFSGLQAIVATSSMGGIINLADGLAMSTGTAMTFSAKQTFNGGIGLGTGGLNVSSTNATPNFLMDGFQTTSSTVTSTMTGNLKINGNLAATTIAPASTATTTLNGNFNINGDITYSGKRYGATSICQGTGSIQSNTTVDTFTCGFQPSYIVAQGAKTIADYPTAGSFDCTTASYYGVNNNGFASGGTYILVFGDTGANADFVTPACTATGFTLTHANAGGITGGRYMVTAFR